MKIQVNNIIKGKNQTKKETKHIISISKINILELKAKADRNR
jgi:hypothetical protein